MTSNGMGVEWVRAQEARQKRLDIWYLEDGRATNPDHPMKGLYTGLAKKYGKETPSE